MSKVKTMPEKNAVPTDPALRIQIDYGLSPDVAALADEYHRVCVEWEEQRDDLLAGRQSLADGANDATVGDILEHGLEFEKRKSDLEESRVSLAWRRFDLLSSLIPDCERAAASARADYERIEQAEFDRFEADGALFGLPGGDSEIGRHQLRYKVRQELVVVSAQGRLNQAEGRIQSLRNNACHPPKTETCSFDWPYTGKPVSETILDYCKPLPDKIDFTEGEATIRQMVGLGGAPLLPEHIVTIREITAALGISAGGAGYVIKFSHLPAHIASKVTPLLRQLPATTARDQQLGYVRNFTRKGADVTTAPSHGHGTSYADRPSGFRKDAESLARWRDEVASME